MFKPDQVKVWFAAVPSPFKSSPTKKFPLKPVKAGIFEGCEPAPKLSVDPTGSNIPK